MAGAGYRASAGIAGADFRALEWALWSAFAGMAERGLGAGVVVAAHDFPVLCSGGEVEFSDFGLRLVAAGAAAVCCAALQELVSASGFEAGKLEGPGVRELRFTEFLRL